MTFVRAALFAAACGLVSIAGCSSDDDASTSSEEQPIGEGEPDPPEATHHTGDAADAAPTGPAVECAIGGAVELENNDTPATATAFTELTFCGVLGTAQDIDYSTFTTPPGTKLSVFQAVIDGKVEFELTLAGAKFGPAETAKFGSGTYLVKAFTKAGKTASYSYRVQFDPQ